MSDMLDQTDLPEIAGDRGNDPSKRERSTIEFPYINLEDAEDGAKAIFREAGTTEISVAQAAAFMGLSATSSGFRVRLSGMKMFGLVEGVEQRIALSELGRRITDPRTAQHARIAAFLRVPLYNAVVERHDGKTLPPPGAMQKEFVGFGVSQKTADRARQVFERSARHALFMKQGQDRFVTPVISGMPGRADAHEIVDADGTRNQENVPNTQLRDPVIDALVAKIPPPGTQWPLDEQVQLLQMLAMAFQMTYKNRRPIRVSADAENIRAHTEGHVAG